MDDVLKNVGDLKDFFNRRRKPRNRELMRASTPPPLYQILPPFFLKDH